MKFNYTSCILLLSLLLFPFHVEAQKHLASFRPLYETSKIASYKNVFTRSAIIDIDNPGKVYAMSVDATVFQPRESSLARIVLEDESGHLYLVAESNRFRNDIDTVRLEQYC